MKTNYPYKGIPLGNGVLIDIIPQLFNNGEAILPMDILKKASEYHIENGGKPYNGVQDPVKFISGALNILKNRKLASKILRHWVIGKEILPEKIETAQSWEKSINTNEITVEAVFGEGAYTVYAYYYPRDKKLAMQNKEDFFPVKIGKTKEDAIKRVLGQTSASSHEMPVIALIMKTDNYNELESLIHGILKMRKRKVDKIRGVEWFYTNPNEIDSIYSFLMHDRIEY